MANRNVNPQYHRRTEQTLKKGKRTEKKETTECSVEMREHIGQLGLSSVKAYKTWCLAHNFSQGLNKNPRQLRDERETAASVRATAVMTGKRRQEREKGKESKRIDWEDICDQVYRRLHESRELASFRSNISKRVLLNTLRYLKNHSNLLDNVNDDSIRIFGNPEILERYRPNDVIRIQGIVIRGIIALVNHHKRWIRPLETCRGRRRSRYPKKQFRSLVRHLFAAYNVPGFMDHVWFDGDGIHQEWFIHVGAGGNIRTAPGLPLPLTKKMAHHFLKAPGDYTVEEALCYGQVYALGGNRRLVQVLRRTQLIETFGDNDFRLSVLRFFIANPMLDLAHVHPIIDYIWNQKYVGDGNIGPPQPNFSMKGRDPEVLLRRVEEWHRQLAREIKVKREWPRSGIGEFDFQEGNAEKGDLKSWSIRELLTSAELAAEGRALSHCVATYGSSCSKRLTSIWSMGVGNEFQRKKILTIEVSLNRGRRQGEDRIMQVRGERNRLPTPKEESIIARWATQEGLQIRSYL